MPSKILFRWLFNLQYINSYIIIDKNFETCFLITILNFTKLKFLMNNFCIKLKFNKFNYKKLKLILIL
jgi:hypothetical protein